MGDSRPRGGELVNHAADANQARAPDPSASAWVSANAGTGKTEVLVRRVLRLLLAGSEPQRILCLTYTKMAAAEMQNRLLKELAAWATLEDGTLRERLAALLGRGPDDAEVKAARRLDRKSTRLNSSHLGISYAVFCLKK